MEPEVLLFKYLTGIVYALAIFFSIAAGTLVYLGLSSKEERTQHRIRLKQNLIKNKDKLITGLEQGEIESWFKKAHYPLGLNGVKYTIICFSILTSLALYYVFIPFLINGPDRGILIPLFLIIGLGLIISPKFPLSLFVFLMKKVIVYQQSKRNVEIFMLYDLLINEIEMMTKNRINTYSVLRNIKPYFHHLDASLTRLLTSWSSDEGPSIALDNFVEELGTKEAESLIGVIKNLDSLDRNTALTQLKGMHNMFSRAQIENYRRKRKVTNDLLGIPIKATHFIIILNFIMVIITMVSIILASSSI